MALVHLVSGSCNQSNNLSGTQFTSTCAQFSAEDGDSCCSGVMPEDVTCPVCAMIIIGRASSPCLPYGMS